MFHNISNPKWFGNWSRLEDDYLGNGGTDIADNFTFSKMEKTCPPNRAIFATEEMAKAGYLSQLDYSKVVEMGDFYTVLNGDIVAVVFDPETGESRSLTDGETARVEGYFTVISRPGSGAKAVDDIRHGITPGSYDISVESHDCTSGRNALAADAPARDAPGKDNQNIG